MLTMIKPPEIKVVSLEEVKAHLRLDHTYEDNYLEMLINASTNFIENYVGRSLMARTYQIVHQRLYDKTILQSIPLMMPPLIEIVEVNRVISSQNKVNIKRFCIDQSKSVSCLECSADYPVVEVIYRAGYGNNVSDIPEDIRHAVLLQVGEFYTNRENAEMTPVSLIQNILEPYRVLRVA